MKAFNASGGLQPSVYTGLNALQKMLCGRKTPTEFWMPILMFRRQCGIVEDVMVMVMMIMMTVKIMMMMTMKIMMYMQRGLCGLVI